MGSLLGIMGRAAWIIGLLCYSVIGQLDWPVNLNHENIGLKFEDYVPYVAKDTVYCDGIHMHKIEPCLGDCGFDYVHTANMTCVYIAHSAICDGEYIHASEECAGKVTGCGRTAKLSDGECEENICNVRNKCQNKLDFVRCDGEYIHKTEPCPGECEDGFMHTENKTCVLNHCFYRKHTEICFKNLECLSRDSTVLCDGEYIREEEECPGSCSEEHGYLPRSNNRCMWRDAAVLCGGDYIHYSEECFGDCGDDGYVRTSNNLCIHRDSAVLCGGDFIHFSEECFEDCGDDALVRTSDNLCMHVYRTVLCGEEYINLTSPRCPDMCKPEECAASKYFKLLNEKYEMYRRG